MDTQKLSYGKLTGLPFVGHPTHNTYQSVNIVHAMPISGCIAAGSAPAKTHVDGRNIRKSPSEVPRSGFRLIRWPVQVLGSLGHRSPPG